MLVNKDSTSRLAINTELWCVVVSLPKLKESLIVNSLWVGGSRIGIKNWAILYPYIFIADKIGRNFGKLLATALWILGLAEGIPGLEV